MNNLIKRRDVDFFVNEEKKTVICKIRPTYNFSIEESAHMDICCGVEEKWMDTWKQNLTGAMAKIIESCPLPNKNQCVAKAVCSGDDVFDVNKGKDIAFAKLNLRLSTHMYNHLYKSTNNIEYLIENLDGLMYNYEHFLADCGIYFEYRY